MNTRNTILSRQSCRNFTSEKLTEDECNILLEAANAAPVAMGNYNDVQLTVIQNNELLHLIEKKVFSLMPNLGEHPTYNAPTLFLINVKKVEETDMILSFCNASCIAENIMIQATDLGIGSVFLFAVPAIMQTIPELCSAAEVPDGFVPAVIVAVGKPAVELMERKATTKILTGKL